MEKFTVHCPNCNSKVVEQTIRSNGEYQKENGVSIEPTELGVLLSVKVTCKENDMGQKITYTIVNIECKKCSKNSQVLVDKRDIVDEFDF